MDFSKFKYKFNNMKISLNFVVSILVLMAVMAFFLLCQDPGGRVCIRWLIMIFIISFLMRGFLTINNMPLWDNGFALSFGLGLALSFFLAFIISALNLAPFGNVLCFGTLLLLSLCLFLLKKYTSVISFKWDFNGFSNFLLGFTVFCLIFLFAFWVIGFNPLIDSGTENYMDYGFMQAIFRQQELAPFDIWFSGEKLNYYYLGQAACVYLTRLSFTSPEYGYNLSLATFWGMVFVMSGEITYGCVGKIRENLIARVAAFVSSLYCAFAGNGHWLIFGIVEPLLYKITGRNLEELRYWFPDGTVYISTEMGDMDNGKNEFPAYSAILGDLHAHVINVIFVLPLVALILDYAFSEKEKKDKSNIILCGILLGLYKGANYWDFAIYFVVVGAVVVFSDIGQRGFKLKTFIDIFVNALIVIGISFLTILPFTLQFKKMSSEICLATTHSPFYKMVILWGFPITVAFVLIKYLFFGRGRELELKKGARLGLLAFILCAIGLVITPEFLYIRDIYGDQYARFNTMFKFTYQAFILLGIIVGITCGLILQNHPKRVRDYTFSILIAVTTVLLAGYTLHGINDWFGDVSIKENRKGISSIQGLEDDESYFPEVEGAKIINEDQRRFINIIEASGLSYSHANAISVITGCSTVCGWFTHEWMWRDNSQIVSARANEVRCFYECGDVNQNRNMIEKYGVNYIFVGPAEYDSYSVDLSGIEGLGQVKWKANINGKIMELVRVD